MEYVYETTRSGKFIPVRELVRCKQCIWWHPIEGRQGFGECEKANGCVHDTKFFCADGEKEYICATTKLPCSKCMPVCEHRIEKESF